MAVLNLNRSQVFKSLTTLAICDPQGTTTSVLRVTDHCTCNRSCITKFSRVLLAPKRTKRPGTQKVQSDSSVFRSCKQHPSVKEPLPLEPFC